MKEADVSIQESQVVAIMPLVPVGAGRILWQPLNTPAIITDQEYLGRIVNRLGAEPFQSPIDFVA